MSAPLPWWSQPLLHIVRTPDINHATVNASVVQRWWLPHGLTSQHGAVALGEVWRRLEGAELAAVVVQHAVATSFERAALRGVAHDVGRGLWWALRGDEVVEGNASGAQRMYAVAGAVIVASADSHRVYVATTTNAVVEIERATGLVRSLAQFAVPVLAMCRTPAGLAVWDGENLVGINIRTAVSMRIAALALPQVAVLAADHRGNFTLASSATVWQCRGDASGLVACELPGWVG